MLDELPVSPSLPIALQVSRSHRSQSKLFYSLLPTARANEGAGHATWKICTKRVRTHLLQSGLSSERAPCKFNRIRHVSLCLYWPSLRESDILYLLLLENWSTLT